MTYQYGADGRITRRELLADNAVIAATTYNYDLRGKMSALRHYRRENGQDVLLSEFTDIGYGSLDRITGYTGNIGGLNGGARDWSGEYEFTYTERGELASESLDTGGDPDHGYTLEYTYDAAGNRLTGGFDYNVNNQIDLEDYSYNASGNPVEYDGINLGFNGDDRLADYGAALTCGYRADGLRAWKDSGAGRTYYLYDGETLLAEMSAVEALTDVNLWGANELACHGDTFYLYPGLFMNRSRTRKEMRLQAVHE